MPIYPTLRYYLNYSSKILQENPERADYVTMFPSNSSGFEVKVVLIGARGDEEFQLKEESSKYFSVSFGPAVRFKIILQ